MFSSKVAPEEVDSDGEDSAEERLLQGLEDCNDFARDLYDMYQKEGLEHYLYPDTDLQLMGDDSDDDDDDDSDDDQPKKKAKKKDGADSKASATDEEKKKEECKQQ